MKRLPLVAILASALVMGACASSSSDKAASASAKADGGKEWWRMSKYSRKADFKTWVYGTVRPGKGLLGGDEDGIVLYQEKRSGSSDSSKPAKVRR